MTHLTADQFNEGVKNLAFDRVALFREGLHRTNPTHPYTKPEYDDELRRHMLLRILNKPACSGCCQAVVVKNNISHYLCDCKTEWYCDDFCRGQFSGECSLLNNGKWHYATDLCFNS